VILKYVLILVPALAFAQEAPPPVEAAPAPAAPSALELRVEELEQSHRILERKLELAEEKAVEAKKKGVSFAVAPGKGFTVTSSDGLFGLQIRTRAQIRDTVLVTPKATTNEINVKTLRLNFSGHVLTPDLRYVIQLALGTNDFEVGNSSPIFDAFVEYNRLRDLNIRFGQFFVPFDRARTIRELALQMVDRQNAVVELTLDRDVGIMFHSNDLGGRSGRIGYAIGIFGGEGRNKFGVQNPGFLYTARFVVKPWGNFDDDIEGDLLRIRRPRMAIGVAGAFNQNTNRARSTTGNTLTLGGYDYLHGAADLVFKYAGFSLLTEILVRKALWNTRVGVDDKGMPLTEWSRNGWGYFVQAGMMVSRLVELTARWNQTMVLGPTDPTFAKAVDETGKEAGAGLNVYLNGHFFKLQADYFYLFGKVEDQGRHQVRVQLDATF
jgi:hypothetical protein